MAQRWITRMYNALREPEQRTSLENPQTPLSFPAEWLLDIFNGGRTDSGIRVSEMTALQVGTVFACVNVISDGVSSLPLHVYKRESNGKRVGKTLATDNALWNILHNEPNVEMTTPTFLKTMMVHALLWGNTYVEIERDNSNQIINLWPRNPARTRPIRLLKPLTLQGDLLPAGTLLFETTDGLMDSSTMTVAENPDTQNIGMRRLILQEDMLHIPGLSLDGRLGQSIVWLCRQAIGLSLATEKYGAKFFGNGARPAGVLTLPSAIEPKAQENLKRSWAEAHGGENQFRVAVLEQGVKYEKIASTPEEGQMLQTRIHQREELCAIFGVPGHMIAASDKSGKSNVEQSSIEFVLYCLHPWLHRIEKELARKLFPKMGRNANLYFPKFDTRKLMYPDAASRATFYQNGKQWGFLNSNVILELEDLNPIEDAKVGEMYWMPINMQDAGDLQKLGAEAQQELDIKKATTIAEHGADLQVKTAKAQAKVGMQQSDQAHAQTMEKTKQDQKHAQTMAKLGHPLAAQPAAGAPAPADGTEPKPGMPGKPTRFTDNTELHKAIQDAVSKGFAFMRAVPVGDDIAYHFVNEDNEEVDVLVFVQAKEARTDNVPLVPQPVTPPGDKG